MSNAFLTVAALPRRIPSSRNHSCVSSGMVANFSTQQKESLQKKLDELVFRFNNRNLPDFSLVFLSLLVVHRHSEPPQQLMCMFQRLNLWLSSSTYMRTHFPPYPAVSPICIVEIAFLAVISATGKTLLIDILDKRLIGINEFESIPHIPFALFFLEINASISVCKLVHLFNK